MSARADKSQLKAIGPDALLSITASAFSQASTLVSMLIVARVIGATRFGELTLVLNTGTAITTVVAYATSLAAVNYVAAYRSTDPGRAGRIAGLALLSAGVSGTLGGAALFAAAPLFASQLSKESVVVLLLGSAATILFNAVSLTEVGLLQGLRAYRAVAILSILRVVWGVPVIVLSTLLAGLPGAAVALAVVSFGNVVAARLFLEREAANSSVRLTFAGVFKEAPVLWNFALPAFLSAASVAVTNWFVMLLLVGTPDGVNQLAMFNVAAFWRNALLFAPAAASVVLLPLMSAAAASGDMVRLRKYIFVGVIAVGLPTFVLASAISVGSGAIAGAYGPDFNASENATRLLAWAAALASVGTVGGYALTALGKLWATFSLNVVWELAVIASAVPLVRSGSTGLAIAFVVAYALQLLTIAAYLALTTRSTHDTMLRRPSSPPSSATRAHD